MLTTIRPPWRESTVKPEAARKWLKDDFRSWFHAAAIALQSEDEKTREAALSLVYDVQEIASACIDAVLGKKTVYLTLDETARGAQKRMSDLGWIVRYGHIYCQDSTGDFQEALVEWTEQLIEGLGEIREEALTASAKAGGA